MRIIRIVATGLCVNNRGSRRGMKKSIYRMMCVLGLLWTGLAAIPATAVEVGEQAPDFKMPATTGADIALSDYRGKKWVFLEFYGADFVPT
jgi:hypothetical protein